MRAAVFLQTFLLTLSLSLDSLVAGFSYGASKIKIPLRSAGIISAVCAATLGLSVLLGQTLLPFVAADTANYLSFALLCLIGVGKLCGYFFKKHRSAGEKITCIEFRLFDVRFLLTVARDHTEADRNRDRVLSAKESLSLALALSADGIAVGVLSSAETSLPLLSGFTLFFNLLFLWLGGKVGNRIAKKIKPDLSWLSGLMLLVLAAMKLM